ncbi:hypothetical protein BJ170DRAFT_589783 [Xylariales sp. AK1849]|nr:hypothetical protein BJ170DRAFT_589783 [Xylariales sp. AK1849]
MYENLWNILRTRQEDEANVILQRIRAGADADALVRTIQDGDLLLQLAPQPEYRYQYEFPYSREMPTFLNNVAWANPYLSSILYGQALISSSQLLTPPEEILEFEGDSRRMYLAPYHTVHLVDKRLASLDVALWTAVISNNSLLRTLLEVYFVFEYPSHPFFHKDIFLDDMISGKHRFCSPLLINAVLAAAWHGYHAIHSRAEYWRPDNLGYLFLAEANRLLDLEQGEPAKLTTIQAAGIINITCNINGIEELGWPYLHKSVELAQQLQLFSPSPESDTTWQIAAGVTSWCLFNWQALTCYHTFREPLLSEPPSHPLPDPKTTACFYGDLYVTYPAGQTRVNTNHGHVFKAISDFRAILNAVGWDSFRNGPDDPKGPKWLSLDRAFEVRGALKVWYDNLPDCLTPDKIALPSHLKIHMQLHTLLISLFEPFEQLIDAVSAYGSPSEIVAQSKACLETLVRLYYLRHGFESYDITLSLYVSLLAWSSLRDYVQMKETGSKDQNAMLSTLVLCAKGLWDQGKSYYVSKAIYRCLKYSLPSLDEARLLRDITHAEDEDGIVEMVQEIRSHRPVGLFSNAKMDVDNFRLSHFISWCKRISERRLQQQPTSCRGQSPEGEWIKYDQ